MIIIEVDGVTYHISQSAHQSEGRDKKMEKRKAERLQKNGLP